MCLNADHVDIHLVVQGKELTREIVTSLCWQWKFTGYASGEDIGSMRAISFVTKYFIKGGAFTIVNLEKNSQMEEKIVEKQQA